MHLGGERHCESKVSYPWTRCNFPDRRSTQTAWSGGKHINHEAWHHSSQTKPDTNKNMSRYAYEITAAISDWFSQITSYLFIHLQQPMKTRGYGMEVTADGPDFTDSPSSNQGSQLQCPNCRKYFPHDLLENHMRDCTGDDWAAYICRIMMRFWDATDRDGAWMMLADNRLDHEDLYQLVMVTSLLISSFPAHVS